MRKTRHLVSQKTMFMALSECLRKTDLLLMISVSTIGR